jgi:NitT/TauT family transport system permease protein
MDKEPENNTRPRANEEPNLGTKEPESPQTQPLQTKPVRTKSRGRKALDKLSGITLRRAIISIVVFLALWQVGSSSDEWFGVALPFIDLVPPPTAVVASFAALLQEPSFWQSAYLSSKRVLSGFLVAMAVGIPFGLLMAVSRTAKGIFFPVFEVLRPIPPLAWVPAAIIFWPTQELSISFVTFLGAFYTIVINVVGGAEEVDKRFIRAARSMGANGWKIFRRVIFPATTPSIVTGAVVGMGITWQVVVAAEMIAGGGSAGGGGGGLGFLVWNSYVGGALPQVVVGMISMGVLGYAFSSILRMLGDRIMPWKKVV